MFIVLHQKTSNVEVLVNVDKIFRILAHWEGAQIFFDSSEANFLLVNESLASIKEITGSFDVGTEV